MSIEWIGDSINDLSVVSMALRMVLSMVCSGRDRSGKRKGKSARRHCVLTCLWSFWGVDCDDYRRLSV